MVHPEKARKGITRALIAMIALAFVLFFAPDAWRRIIGLGAEAAFYVAFKGFQEREFAEWQSANVTLQPSNGWRAVGWGFVGLFLECALFFIIVTALTLLGIRRR